MHERMDAFCYTPWVPSQAPSCDTCNASKWYKILRVRYLLFWLREIVIKHTYPTRCLVPFVVLCCDVTQYEQQSPVQPPCHVNPE
jgi:hypothetical protein